MMPIGGFDGASCFILVADPQFHMVWPPNGPRFSRRRVDEHRQFAGEKSFTAELRRSAGSAC